MFAVPLRQLATCTVAAFLLLGSSGCASLLRSTARSHRVAANGLAQADNEFRLALIAGNYGRAYERSGKVKSGAPQDQLLRALYRGTTAFHAGEYTAAANAFAEADRLAEERETRSVSRQAASLITNDQVLSYLPSRTERLFTRYYAMMSYLRADDRQAATVEARRLGLMLQTASDSIATAERAVHAMLRDAAGAVFEAMGETNDALVSYRNAALLRGASPQAIDSISIAPPSPDSATVIVFVESGFVAHRVNQELSVPLGTRRQSHATHVTQVDTATPRVLNGAGPLNFVTPFPPVAVRESSRTGESDDSNESLLDAPAAVAAILAAVDGSPDGIFAGDERNWRRRRTFDGNIWEHMGDAASIGTTFLNIAWPALVRSAIRSGPIRLHTSQSVASTTTGADISDAIAADLRRALPSMLARLVVRSAAKAKITDAVGDEYGRFAGVLAGIAGGVLERADTRSWQLLPAHIAVVRTRVAAGGVDARITMGGEFDTFSTELPKRTVVPGEMIVTSTRIFPGRLSPARF